jgi:hypothetical protein
MDVLFEMYKADASGAEKEQNNETKAAEATKRTQKKIKLTSKHIKIIDSGSQQKLIRFSHFSFSIIIKLNK